MMRKLILGLMALLLSVPAFAQSTTKTYLNGNSTTTPAAVCQWSSDGINTQLCNATTPLPVTTSGTTTNGTPGGTPPTTAQQIMGTDGTNSRVFKLDTSGNQQVVGNVASGAADSGNPNKVGGVYNSTLPTFATGQRGDIQLDPKGNLFARMVALQAAPGDGVSTGSLVWATDSGTPTTARLLTVTPYYYNGGVTNDRMRGDTNGLVVQSGLSSTFWNYSSGTAGILSNTTTAVTMKAAAGASVRNYVKTCQIATTVFGAAVPIAIRDGAGGTVLFAAKVSTAGWLTPVQLTFDPPLKGTANTLTEVATPTVNTSGTVDVNCQGFTGS